MTREEDEVRILERIVVTLDICSSTQIIEDLLKNQHIKAWRDLIISMKGFLTTESEKCGGEVHKFIGDGWLLLFDGECSGKTILGLLSGSANHFDASFGTSVLPLLDTRPRTSGLTFGIDGGKLIQIVMQENTEYLGRPINIACRLQGAIDENDIRRGFRILMSDRLFRNLSDDFEGHTWQLVERPLKNIGDGKEFPCDLISLLNTGFRLIETRYGTQENNIDVTDAYAQRMKDARLDVIVSNKVIGFDPVPHQRKTLWVKYSHDGNLRQQEFEEESRMKLP